MKLTYTVYRFMHKKLFTKKYIVPIIVGFVLLVVGVFLAMSLSSSSPRSSVTPSQGDNSSQDDVQQPETGAALAPAASVDTEKKTQSSSENARSQQNTPQAGEVPAATPTSPNRSSTTSKKPTTSAKEPSAAPQGKPGYTDRGTQVSRINDTPTRVTYRITFNIAPNQYFGTPMIELVMYHYDVCVNSESSLRKTFRYNGNNSFFVDCVIDKSRPEARLGSEELYASLNLTAQNGEGIVGGIGGYRYYLPSGYSK